MTSEARPAAAVLNLSAAELSLVGDAVALLFTRTGRQEECRKFALAHPELQLLYPHEPPVEEDL